MVRPSRRSSAFTLAELLVVMSVIVILISVSGPALKGLFGSKSRKSATGQVLGSLELARTTALEKGAAVYVGFATRSGSWPTSPTPVFAFSRYIVFRDRIDTDPAGRTFIALGGWQQLPVGVVFAEVGALVNAPNVTIKGTDQFPPVPNGSSTDLIVRAVKFNAAGVVEQPATGTVEVWLTDGFYSPNGLSFVPTNRSSGTGGKPASDRISLARYTGRAQLDAMPLP